jgi:hypothetical protein
MATYFYDRPSTNQRRNRYIYPPSNENLRIFNLVDLFTSTRTGFDAFADAFVYPRTSLMFMQFGVILTRWVWVCRRDAACDTFVVCRGGS